MRKFIIIFLLFLPWCLKAQPGFNYPVQIVSVSPKFLFQSWEINEGGVKKTISQFVTPVAVVMPVSANFDLILASSNATTSFDNGTSYNLNGLTDGKIRVLYRMANSKILVNAGINIPSGKNAFNQNEGIVAAEIAEPVLGFHVRSFGKGFNVDLGLAYAHRLRDNLFLGIGFGYLANGEYKFSSNQTNKFKPGNELSMTLGLDIRGEKLFLRGDLLYRSFATDKMQNQNIFKQGSQIELEGLCQVRMNRFALVISARNVIKSSNKMISGGRTVLADRDFIGSSFWGQSNLVYNLNNTTSIIGNLSLRRFGDSDIQMGNATIISSGVGLQYKLSEMLLLHGNADYLTGDAENGRIDLSGTEIYMGAIFKY